MKFVSPENAEGVLTNVLDLDHLLSDSRWEQLADFLPDGLALIDRTGIVRYVNSAAESIGEVPRASLIGQPLHEFLKRSALEHEGFLEAFNRGVKINRVMTTRARQTYLLSMRPVRHWSGEVTCFILLLRDLEQMTQLQSDAQVGLFSAQRNAVEHHAPDGGEGMVLCRATATLLESALKALTLGSRLLLLGESGVGKTEFARLLHRRSGAASRPFIHVNCGSIPETLFESEMFGYERGSFTGALSKGKQGLVEAADGGILFLDEIGEMPLSCQSKMLQVLEEGAIHRVGAISAKRIRVQFIAATNRDLRSMVAAGTFRRDLYYRVSVVSLKLPPLRECPEVVIGLIDRFIKRIEQRRLKSLRLEPAARRKILSHPFSGNVRELQNMIEQLAVVCDQNVAVSDVNQVLSTAREAAPISQAARSGAEAQALKASLPQGPLKDVVRRYESRVVQDAIRLTGSKRKAADLLGVDIATIVRKSRLSGTSKSC